MEYIMSAVPTVLLVLIEVLVVLAGVGAISLIKKLVTKTGIEIDEKTMDDIRGIVGTAVNAVNQKFTDKYKAANNGKLTEEQQEELFDRTKNIVMSGLSSAQLEALMKRYGMSGEEAVDIMIEDTVRWSH